uniref:ankyrin repeat and SOCS box protein 9 isoform X2 n=1 Tax=Jaculus jaculus TaxID=51337 RepID=UPI001E1B04BB|nr:ankyrin repeat and SOCS box protein 9 isoform X2 [Jaculus jaculus]
MDDEQWGRNHSKPQKPGGSSDTRLLSNPNPLMGDVVSDWSPLHDAAINGRLLSLRNLIKQVDGMTIDWRTPLFNACVSGSQDCVKLLLQHGASPHPGSDLASPIHEAAKRGHVQCIESLVAHGGNIDHNIQHLGTPLYVACKNQQMFCAKKLLESGACVNQGKGLDSPLHIVARMSSEELAHLLIDFGADTQAKNAEGKCPMELIPPESPLAQVFLQREGPPSLMQLCRLRIRKCFGIYQHHKITELVLPEDLKRFLLHI